MEVSTHEVTLVVLILVVLVTLALEVSVVSAMAAVHSDSLRHGRKSDTFGEIGKRVDESSLLGVAVVEAAAVAKLAGTSVLPVLARNGLII